MNFNSRRMKPQFLNLLFVSLISAIFFSACTEISEQDPRYQNYLEAVEREKENRRGIIRKAVGSKEEFIPEEQPDNQLEPGIINKKGRAKPKDTKREPAGNTTTQPEPKKQPDSKVKNQQREELLKNKKKSYFRSRAKNKFCSSEKDNRRKKKRA